MARDLTGNITTQYLFTDWNLICLHQLIHDECRQLADLVDVLHVDTRQYAGSVLQNNTTQSDIVSTQESQARDGGQMES